MDRRYRKPHRYKKRKPIFRKKFLALGFLMLMVAGAFFYGLFLWKIFWVGKITVSGEEKTTKEEIEFVVEKKLNNKILFFETKSIFLVDGGQIKKDILNAFPGIIEAKVKKSLFNAIKVEITERKALALWCENKSCFLLDKEGVIFALPAEASAEEGRAPAGSGLIVVESGQSIAELFLGKTVMTKDKLAQVLAIQSKIAEASNLFIKKAVLVSDERLDVETIEGWTIRFNLKSDLDWQVTELKLALEKQISPAKRKILEYIDLRFSRVYYK